MASKSSSWTIASGLASCDGTGASGPSAPRMSSSDGNMGRSFSDSPYQCTAVPGRTSSAREAMRGSSRLRTTASVVAAAIWESMRGVVSSSPKRSS